MSQQEKPSLNFQLQPSKDIAAKLGLSEKEYDKYMNNFHETIKEWMVNIRGLMKHGLPFEMAAQLMHATINPTHEDLQFAMHCVVSAMYQIDSIK